MPDDLITPETLNKELLKSLFDAAFLETSYDKDGDLRVKEGISCFLFAKEDRIRLLAVFGFKPGVTNQQKLQFVNRVNAEYVIVRACIDESRPDALYFDYDIPVAGGITKKAVVLVTRRFLKIPWMAIDEFGRDLVE